ncbi:hypothetical protein QUD93_13040 [Lactococcus lactis]|uniref:hypothetical protein n=1 Tax=Lactococcus lactis TaxID=1358 RepID=UPI0025A300ED|nr:hypothetical protein [Lactococcus lactis]MDM7545380.1 hypothetical protein [Lactococcus lactis]
MSDTPKFLSKQELELQEVNYIFSLRAERDELQEQLNTAKKYIEHVIGTIKHDGHLGTIQTDWILPDLEKALAAIGWDGCPVGLIVKNGLTKEELEGSDDE